jgi:hypothetical protein
MCIVYMCRQEVHSMKKKCSNGAKFTHRFTDLLVNKAVWFGSPQSLDHQMYKLAAKSRSGSAESQFWSHPAFFCHGSGCSYTTQIISSFCSVKLVIQLQTLILLTRWPFLPCQSFSAGSQVSEFFARKKICSVDLVRCAAASYYTRRAEKRLTT